MRDDGSDDPFRDLRLDAEFVRTAGAREPTAEDRARRARQEAERRAEEEALLKEARRANRSHRRAGRAVRRVVSVKVIVWVTVIAVLFSVWWSKQRSDDTSEATSKRSGVATADFVPPGEARPTPRPSGTATPLARPADPPREPGLYRFMATQPASAAPVAYDPCRMIPVVVNNRTMPAGGARLVEDALAQVSVLTGLQFQVEGPTDEPPAVEREEFQPARYGDRWAPVLVAWSDPAESPGLADDRAGVGGSTWTNTDAGANVYVTGHVTLDGPYFRELLDQGDGYAEALAIVLHEVGHLVGLDHVDDRNELMHPEYTDRDAFGPGDRRGLAQLGADPCVPML